MTHPQKRKKKLHHPHVLRREAVFITVALVALIECAFLLQSFAVSHSTGQLGAVLPAVVVALTNEQRASGQLSSLASNELLAEAAHNAAEDMAEKGYFAHVSPDGTSPWYWLKAVGYRYQYAGQNLAVNYNDSSELLQAWMDSPTHRENILDADYTEIGVGMATGTYNGKEAVFVVQFFASPLHGQVAVAKTAPTPTKKTIVAPPPAVAQTIPAGTAVLGTETPNLPLSLWNKITSSPNKYATLALGILALFFAGALIIGLLPFFKRRLHPNAAFNGAALVAVLLAVIVLNQKILLRPLALPADNQNAAVVLTTQP